MLSGGLTHSLNPTNPRRGKPEMRRCPGFCPYYWKTCFAISKPIVLTSATDASLKWCHQHLHFGTSMPSGGVHLISTPFHSDAWAEIMPHLA
jgi:hypothetical protein